jgi:hypothetical protein
MIMRKTGSCEALSIGLRDFVLQNNITTSIVGLTKCLSAMFP